MILTGPEIIKQVSKGSIMIDPFDVELINPNSYDFRLGNYLIRYTSEVVSVLGNNNYEEVIIPESGLTLPAGSFFLGYTIQCIGSNEFVPIISAKSSIARLGLFVHVTANLIDLGFYGQFTLQLHPVLPIVVYPGMKIGQVSFWKSIGEKRLYCGKYQNSIGPMPSKIELKL